MAKLIEADTRLDAWMQAADYLLDYSPMLNLTLAIESPTTGGSNDAIDKFLTDEPLAKSVFGRVLPEATGRGMVSGRDAAFAGW